jgi:hypothetical protein
VLAGRSKEDAERVAVAYLQALRRVAERDHWAEVHRLPMHNSSKVGAQAFALENGCVVLAYKKDVEADFWRGEALPFEAVGERVAKREFDHLVVLYPSMIGDDAALEAVAAEYCARSLAAPAWSDAFAVATKDLHEVRSKLAQLLTSNPWLEKTLSKTGESLSSVEDRLASLSTVRAENERRRAFDRAEDAVERAGRFRPDQAAARLERINQHTVELFTKELVKTYRRQVEAAGLSKGEEPPFYRAYPYQIEAWVLSNKVAVVSFRHAPQAPGFQVSSPDFERASEIFDDHRGAFVMALDNDARLEAAEARFLGEELAGSDVEDAQAISRVRQIAADLLAAEGEVSSAGKTNPWLEPQAMKLVEALSRSRKILEKAVTEFDGLKEHGAVLLTQVIRRNLELAPNAGAPAREAPAPPPRPAEGAAARGARLGATDGPVRELSSRPAPSAGAVDARATRGSVPALVNVPETPEHVFQEVEYYRFPKSESVRAAESAAKPSVPRIQTDVAPAAGLNVELRAKVFDMESRLAEYERRLYYIDKYTEMVQKQQLDKIKLMRELIRVEGRRNRSRALGVAGAALAVAVLALIPVWPQTLAAIRAFFSSLGL